MTSVEMDFVAAGGNRHPSAADWKRGTLAFGAGKNLAIWNAEKSPQESISCLLGGHTDEINAVRIHKCAGQRCIITGSADKTIRIWERNAEMGTYATKQTLDDHSGSVNAIAMLEDQEILVSGAADGSLKIWDFSNATARLVQTVTLRPRYLPLSCALTTLQDGAIVLAVAGTSNSIQLYTRSAGSHEFLLQATLTGHEGWVRSLDFARDGSNGDLLLASASQDKYIRLWRFSRSREAERNGVTDPAVAIAKKSLSNKAHQVGSEGHKYSVTFEALLIGHEDWIYTVRWAPSASRKDLRLLSSSADNSLAIWQADESSGVWVCQTRLGEISSQKGSTTATGSTGGFWIGLWQPDGNGVASLGRTGSWRRWRYDAPGDIWMQQTSISGHVKEVQGLAWAPDGSYLLSTSSDQTTRLWAEWKQDDATSWHEFARPQIHGYDLNCLATLTPNQFISGADEKLLRVFNKPKALADLLSNLCGHSNATPNGTSDLPTAATIPVLGLSNKAVTTAESEEDAEEPQINGDDPVTTTASHKSSLSDLPHPPLEDHLARHTLFPEHEKLYGHGYEISAVAASPSGDVVATACKASSLDHAVIRFYECETWREVKPSLRAHGLTVTSLAFSRESGNGGGRWLLSVGRDRQWALFRRQEEGDGRGRGYELWKANPKGHSRMILDCAWAPDAAVFATAGRDKAVKLWKIAGEEVVQACTITASSSVTAIDFAPTVAQGKFCLAYGTEEGSVSIAHISSSTLEVVDTTPLPPTLNPCAAINALRWRPQTGEGNGAGKQHLAIASDDCSVRIVDVQQAG